MRVCVLNDLPVAGSGTSGFGSGAELSIGAFVKEGHRRGHTVDIVCPEYCTHNVIEDADLVVTKNLVNFSQDQLKIATARPYVAWPSDYAWTRWRLYFAYQEAHRRLPCLPRWYDFFAHSRFNVFLSPLHLHAYNWVMPGIENLPHMLSPPPVRPEWYAFHTEDEGLPWEPNTACTINGGLPFKGLYQNLLWAQEHPHIKFRFVGSIRDQVNLPPNAEHTGILGLKRLVAVLRSTETYVELPDTVQPYNQSAVQGLLSCKHVATNELLGAASYDWFRKGDRVAAISAIKAALPDLWTRIEKEVPA